MVLPLLEHHVFNIQEEAGSSQQAQNSELFLWTKQPLVLATQAAQTQKTSHVSPRGEHIRRVIIISHTRPRLSLKVTDYELWVIMIYLCRLILGKENVPLWLSNLGLWGWLFICRGREYVENLCTSL